MNHNKYLYITAFLLLAQNGQVIPVAGYSQTESYLKALAPNRKEAYDKIKKTLVAPEVDAWGRYDKNGPMVSINPAAFETFINQVIETEKKHGGYYAFYHGSQKEGFLTHLIRTYISQIEHGWTRDDYFLLRSADSFYKKSAKSAADYMKQNMPYILKQFIPKPGSKHLNCPLAQGDIPEIGYKCTQFDLCTADICSGDWRNQEISTSPAFIAGVDDTPQELREMSEQDRAAWESAFYYFAQGLTWSSVLKLYGRLVDELKKYSPDLFNNTPTSIALRKYIAFKFNMVADLLFLHPEVKKRVVKGSVFDLHSNAGMMFQFLIPANIVDDVVYLSWANGILWQRTINGFQGGWDNALGAYTKVSPILERLQSNPHLLGRSMNLLQTRIIYKDQKYFNDPKSPIKINLIHSLSPALFTSIEDSLKAIARVIVENKQAIKKGTQKTWFEQTDIASTVQTEDAKLKTLLASKAEKDQIEAMNIMYYLAAIGINVKESKQMAEKLIKSYGSDKELGKISEEILKLQ